MSKSIKPKNNIYIDSTGITHNRELLSNTITNLKPVVLYYNSNGTNGTVNLNDTINNYSYIEIYANWYNSYSLPAVRLSRADIKNGQFLISYIEIGANKIIFSKRYNISGTSITKSDFSYYIINTGETATWDVCYINKVVGYK